MSSRHVLALAAIAAATLSGCKACGEKAQADAGPPPPAVSPAVEQARREITPENAVQFAEDLEARIDEELAAEEAAAAAGSADAAASAADAGAAAAPADGG